MTQGQTGDVDHVSKLIHDLATPLAVTEINTRVLIDVVSVLRSAMASSGQVEVDSTELTKLEKLAESYLEQTDKFREVCQRYAVNGNGNSIGTPQAEKAVVENRDHLAVDRVKKVLLVEDEEIHREITIKQLDEGYRVVAVSTAAEALTALTSDTFDVILLDYILPDTRGEPLINDVWAATEGKSRIYIISNMPHLDLSVGARERVYAMLSKPFKLAEFLQFDWDPSDID